MKTPITKKEYTELELLHVIMEDVGRLSNIEWTLQEEGENQSVYNRIMGIEFRTYETVNLLHSIKLILMVLTCLTGLIALLLVFN